MGSERSVVGMLWSAVAMVRSGRRTFKPRSRSPENACGEVTSCTRCRSIYNRVGAPACSWTTWEFQTFSIMVFIVTQLLVVSHQFSVCEGLSREPGAVTDD